MKYIIVVVLVLFTACATKIKIKSLKPSKINDSDIKQVSIKIFKNDTLGLANTISSKMKTIIFNGKTYFNIINRNVLTEILKEQELQDSGIVDNAKEIEALSDVRSIITGEVIYKNYSKTYYYEKRTNYNRCISYEYNKNKKRICKRYKVINQRCENHQYDLSASIFINKISNAKTIYSRNFDEHKEINRCDYSNIIDSEYKIFKNMTNNIANKLVKDITPRYEYRTVEVIEKEDITYTNKQSKLFKQSISYIKNNNIKKANGVLKKLVFQSKEKSYVALYNLALTYEALGNFSQALVNYNKALYIKNDYKKILNSIKRVKEILKKEEKANIQISA